MDWVEGKGWDIDLEDGLVVTGFGWMRDRVCDTSVCVSNSRFIYANVHLWAPMCIILHESVCLCVRVEDKEHKMRR